MYSLMNKDNQVAVFDKAKDPLDNDFVMVSEEKDKLPIGFRDIFDADSLKIKSMAPVFDNNQAFLPYAESEDFSQIGTYLGSKLPRIGEDFVNIAKAVMTPDIRRDLINLQGFQFTYYDSEKFPRQRLAEIEKLINKQIIGIIDKNKMYTVDVFPKD